MTVTVEPGSALTKSDLMVPNAPVSEEAADTVIVPEGVDGDEVVVDPDALVRRLRGAARRRHETQDEPGLRA